MKKIINIIFLIFICNISVSQPPHTDVGFVEAERIAVNSPKTRELSVIIDYLNCTTDGMSDYYKLKVVLEIMARNMCYNYVYMYDKAINVQEYHKLFIMARGDTSFPQYIPDFDYNYPLTINDYNKLDSLWKILRYKNGRYIQNFYINAYKNNIELGKLLLSDGTITTEDEFIFKKGFGSCVSQSNLFVYICSKLVLNDLYVDVVSSDLEAHTVVRVRSKTNTSYVKYIDPTCTDFHTVYTDPITKKVRWITKERVLNTYFMVDRKNLPYNKGLYN